MVKRLGRVLVGILAVIGAGSVVMMFMFLRDGISSRPQPSRLESAAAARLRALAIPASARDRRNPIARSPEVLEEALAHWADHCAVCHGNDGSGDTTIGRGLYPRPPDMRLRETQDLSDGTLFYIIEQGVRLSGMPAWGDGTPEGETASWHLVHFIRQLPKLTSEELERMKGMNPKSPDEWREEEEMRKFLEGEPPPKPAPAPKHKHGGHE